MKESISSRLIWGEASKSALAFAAVTICCGLIKRGIAAWDPGTFVTALLGAILWAGEFFGCIWLMMFFMRKLVRDFDGVMNTDTNRYGRRIALLSAIVIASVNFLILYFTPDEELQKTIDEALAAYASMLDSNSMSVMEDMMQNLPVITFFSNLIYCFLYGTLLSAILSRGIPQPDPFANIPGSPDNQ